MTSTAVRTSVALLEGSFSAPSIRVRFDRSARHPSSRIGMLDWVRALPGRTFDPETSSWVITGTGGLPSQVLASAGFDIAVDPSRVDQLITQIGSAALRAVGATSRQTVTAAHLADAMHTPLAKVSASAPGTVLVRHRFAGFDIAKSRIGHGARWDKKTGRFEVDLGELLDEKGPKGGIIYTLETLEALRAAQNRRQEALAALPRGIGPLISRVALSDGESNEAEVAELASVVGEVPDWFGLSLFPFQRAGAIAAAGGHNFIADEPGLGKSRQALAAVAIAHEMDPRGRDLRLVIVCPPVVATHWQREATSSNLGIFAASTMDRRERFGESCSPTPESGAARPVRAFSPGAVSGREGMGPGGPLEPGSAPPNRHSASPPGDTILPSGGESGHFLHAESPSNAKSGTKKRAKRSKKAPAVVPKAAGLRETTLRALEDRLGEVVLFKAGRKEPALPARGVVIIPDSLLASRPALLATLIEWSPTAFFYDEVHRAKTWDSARAISTRQLAEATSGIRLSVSGTPLFANPVELASPLAISGQLGLHFSNFTTFASTFARQDRFDRWQPISAMLPELRRRLDSDVWVRRTKKQVLKQLPPKLRMAEIVDVDLGEFRRAHKDVGEKIELWASEFLADKARLPAKDEIQEWAAEQIGLMSPLRKAAGLAKVPVAVERLVDWHANTAQVVNGSTVYTRPLVMWAHHNEVVTALAEALPEDLRGAVAVIDGSTPAARRQQYADDMQAGRLCVLICSISAAGVGITLTRASDVLFVETDWTPALVVQAEDRCHRISQVEPVTVKTMIAPGTLDEHIQNVLATKAELLDQVAGGDNAVAVLERTGESLSGPSAILEGIANDVIVAMKRAPHAKPAA